MMPLLIALIYFILHFPPTMNIPIWIYSPFKGALCSFFNQKMKSLYKLNNQRQSVSHVDSLQYLNL